MSEEEKQQQPEATPKIEATTHVAPPETNKPKDNKKEKCRPMAKVVIRRLPPTMTQEQFLEQISPVPDHDYMYYVKADMSLGPNSFCRAYINFLEQKDIFLFREKFDNYVFVDAKGLEYPAVVEFAPFQRLPKKRVGKKKDLKCGTIESDPYYISFLDSLKSQESETSNAQAKTEYSYQPSDTKKVTTTPLLEYLKQRKQEKQRIREEKREERRRRDIERRKAKEEPMISKVLKNPEADKEPSKDNKENKDERILQKESKNRGKKDEKVRDKVTRDAKPVANKSYKDKESKNKETKYHREENAKKYGKKDDEKKHEEVKERKTEEKRGKSYEKMRQEKKKLAEAKRQETQENNQQQKGKKSETGEEDKKSGKDDSRKVTKDSKEPSVKEKKDNSTVQNSGDKVSNLTKSQSSEDIDKEGNKQSHSRMVDNKIVKRRNSLESVSDGGAGDGAFLRRHKSLDGTGKGNFRKSDGEDKDFKKDPRRERRIRNKDRPAMEIYRPGMGKFSKQRIGREKSTNDERATSPTPNSKSKAEQVRTMTFKRSVSRDTS